MRHSPPLAVTPRADNDSRIARQTPSFATALAAVLASTALGAGCGKDPPKHGGGPPAKAPAAPEKPAPPKAPTTTPERQLVEAAIQVAGGLDNLRATNSARVESTGTSEGAKFSLVTFREGPKRIRQSKDGDKATSIEADSCWNSVGEMSVECDKDERDALKLMLAATHLTRLFPLAEEDRFGLKLLEPGKVSGLAVRRLEVTAKDLPVPIVLSFDDKAMLVQFSYESTYQGKKGTLAASFSDFRDVQGTKFPYHSELRFDEKLIVNETVTAVSFGKLENTAFARPPSFNEGDVKVKKADPEVVAYATHKGTLDKLAETVRGLRSFIDKKGYVITGSLSFVYPGEPPVNENQLTELEVWLPLSLRPPEEDIQDGLFGVRVIAAADNAYTYVRGTTPKAFPKFATVKSWAQQNGYEATGPVRQVVFNDPQTTPEAKQVTEVRIAVKKAGKPADAPAAP